MLVNAVERTQTAAIVKNRDGASAAEALTEAVDRAVDRHHAEWERNLVSRWGTLSGGEIEQVCIAIAKRDEPTFMRFAQRIGGSVKSLNEPLLDRAATEVLAEIFERPRS